MLEINPEVIGEQRIICSEGHVLPVRVWYADPEKQLLFVEVLAECLEREGYTPESFQQRLSEILIVETGLIVTP